MRAEAWRKFWQEESGATALEYGLICALVFLPLAATMPLVAKEVIGLFNLVATTWQNAVK